MKCWENKTAYQIYPKSFLDTNGDGIGDLQGIIRKLDYLASLSIDLIWISPCFCSPMADEGYDISDYYNIDPCFGTMADFDELLAKAKEKGIGILMDLVVNHCSDEHEWFKNACLDPEGKYGKYFYIESFDGEHYPNNLRSVFGGRAWDVLPGHPDKVYMHSFHRKQPDLNWENSEVREEVYKMVNWWLDKGLAGFRIDAINHVKKVLPWHDYEPDGSDGLCAVSAMLKEAKGLDVLLHELRDRCFVPHDAFTVGEVFDITKEKLIANIGEDGYFCSIFDFAASHRGRNYEDQTKTVRVLPMEEFKDAMFAAQENAADVGTFSLVIENHDQPRAATHFLAERSEKTKKLLGGIYFFAKGIPFIYQGQEIGMENMVYTDRSQLLDVSAMNMHDTVLANGGSREEALATVSALSRDNARTPMQWNTEAFAGFSDAGAWQPVNPNYETINVSEQEGRTDSVLNFYRAMSALRRNPAYNEVFAKGRFVPYLREETDLIAYRRKLDEKEILVLANACCEEREITLEDGTYQVLLNNSEAPAFNDCGIVMEGWQFVILEREN